jgi:hypothetical protein
MIMKTGATRRSPNSGSKTPGLGRERIEITMTGTDMTMVAVPALPLHGPKCPLGRMLVQLVATETETETETKTGTTTIVAGIETMTTETETVMAIVTVTEAETTPTTTRMLEVKHPFSSDVLLQNITTTVHNHYR